MGNTYTLDSTATKPTDETVEEDSIIYEVDTEDRYRFNKYRRWELIPPLSLKSKRIQTLFIPLNNQTGLIFGDGSWQAINAELHSSGNMVYMARTSATSTGTAADSGWMQVNDFATVEMLPKVQMIFSFSDTGSNSGAFIGLRNDALGLVVSTTAFFASGDPCIGLGYRSTDSTYQIFHNDSSGAVNIVDTTIPRDTNVYKIEIEYETSTSVRLSLYDIDMELVFEDTYTTEIPGSGIDLAFEAIIQNNNFSARYGVRMYDYIRLEKTRPPLSATLDF